ncbi:hypothetical protein ACIRQF_08545 [Streptomyces sp. NPDC101191]|uniref:hypothetical protein n=1 Tax=Streptomyces sp. NPDC101191 TaxID=3366126 RepID=UPI003803CAD7
MSTPEKRYTQVGEQTRERSAEQRNIPVPTPKDVRAKAEKGREKEPPADDAKAS